MRKRLAVLAVAVLALAGAAEAGEPGTWGRGWAGGETILSPGTDAKTQAVGWAEGQIGLGRWGVAGTVGVLGTTGMLDTNNPATFSAFRVQGAVHYSLLDALAGVASCGPSAGVEYGVPLKQGSGQTLHHPFTAGVGWSCSGSDWRFYLLAGVDMGMPGAGLIGYAQVPTSTRTAMVARTALGPKQRYQITLDVVVRVF